MTLTPTNNLSGQKATTNASYAAGSLMDSVNHSGLGQNSFVILNKAREEAGSTLNHLGQNMSDIGSEMLNETKVTAKKFGIGAADVLSNISGEIKEGISGNSSK